MNLYTTPTIGGAIRWIRRPGATIRATPGELEAAGFAEVVRRVCCRDGMRLRAGWALPDVRSVWVASDGVVTHTTSGMSVLRDSTSTVPVAPGQYSDAASLALLVRWLGAIMPESLDGMDSAASQRAAARAVEAYKAHRLLVEALGAVARYKRWKP